MKKVSFDKTIKYEETYSADEYDRKRVNYLYEDLVANKKAINFFKQDNSVLNMYKLNEMIVHIDSTHNLKFYIP